MIQAQAMENATPFDRLLLILCGAEKSGKSRCAATARKPILFFDFDKRAQSLAGIKDVFALTFLDEQQPRMPTGFSDALTTMTKIEGGAKIKDLVPGSNDERRPKTIVFDSLASIGKSAMAYALYSNKDIRRELSVGGQKVFMPKNWDSWNAESESVFALVMRAMAIVDMDIILIFHETAEETPDSSAEHRKFTGRKELYPGRYQVFNRYFNEVWRMSRETGGIVPSIQVVPDYRFTASSSLDFSKIPVEKLSPKDTGPNISNLIQLVTGKV